MSGFIVESRRLSGEKADVRVMRVQGIVQKEVKRHMQVQGQIALNAFQRQHPQGPPGISLKACIL